MATLVAALAVGAQVNAPLDTPLRGQLHAIILEPGDLRVAAEPTSELVLPLEPGQVLRYFGQRADAFGRVWAIVGDPDAWVKRTEWFGIAADREEIARLDVADLLKVSPPAARALALLTTTTPEQVVAAARVPVSVPVDWWKQIERRRAYGAEVGEVLGLGAFQVPDAITIELLDLIGGVDSLGPWPDEPEFGRLFISELLPLIWRFDGDGWELLDGGRSLSGVLSLLSNPELRVDPRKPSTPLGPALRCWTLQGGYDQRNTIVGRVATVPPAPVVLPRARRAEGSELLGLRDLSLSVRPLTTDRLQAPVRLLAAKQTTGISVDDASARQAVYLEQSVPPAITHRLRGRQVRLLVYARAESAGEDVTATATPSIEILAGDVRETVSGTVSVTPTPMSLTIQVPDDAEQITVRLLPLDRSIAVAERAKVIFESASLVPVEWPSDLQNRPVRVHRIRVVSYTPALRFTRATLAISERPPEELVTTWQAMASSGRWSVEEQQEILAGELHAGMSLEEVRLAWGEAVGEETLGSLRRWDWEERTAGFGADGRLVAWAVETEQTDRPGEWCLADILQ